MPQPIFVIDACIAVKWFINQGDDAEQAKNLLRIPGAHFLAPDFFMIETLNVFLAQERKGRLSYRTFTEMRYDFDLICAKLVTLIPCTDLEAEACNIAYDLKHSIYDCLYLALAQENNLPFVTADMALIRKLHQSNKNLAKLVVPLSEIA